MPVGHSPFRVAIVGSRSLRMDNIGDYLPPNTTEIVSGGAKGIDQSAKIAAAERRLHLTEFLPEYARYGRAAPLIRNRDIVRYADYVLIVWDGTSRGTRAVIEDCKRLDKPHLIIYKNGCSVKK